MIYKVKKIFGPTIQGEGSKAGTVVSFVRLSGCNRWSGLEKDKSSSICHFCDTDFYGGSKMDENKIVRVLDSIGVKHVVISGGEPTIWNLEPLFALLNMKKYFIHLETNGSNDLDLLEYFSIYHLTISPKQIESETKLQSCDDLKILYPFLFKDEHYRKIRARNRFLQPIEVDGTSGKQTSQNTFNAIKLMAEDNQYHDYRLSLQIHKFIGAD